MVKNPIKNYKFWIKLIGGVILVVFAFAMIFNETTREQMVVGVVGGILLVYSIIRIIPMIKTLEKGWAKVICLIEIIIDLLVAIMFLTGGFNFSDSESTYVSFVTSYFRFFLGFVLYLRGIVYCINSIIVKEQSDMKQFFANIACLTLGVAVFCIDKFDVEYLGWVMLVVAGLCGVVLIGEGTHNYFNYRKEFKDIRDNKSKEKTSKDEVDKNKEKKDEIKKPKDKKEDIIIDDKDSKEDSNSLYN